LTNARVFNGFGCTGECVARVVMGGAPAGTQSYALTVYDPDADRQWLVALGGHQHSRQCQ
jgi:phosphatidylethanolamine-binding protein (PEBP) family uncharacterized protein